MVYVLKKSVWKHTPKPLFFPLFFKKKFPPFFLRGAKIHERGVNFFLDTHNKRVGWVVAPFSPSSSSSSSLDGMKSDGERR